MKCYFNAELEAQGICRNCSRFVSRRYSKIKNDAFLCIVCALGGEAGMRDWVTQSIEKTLIGACGVCHSKLYEWPNDDYGSQFKLIFGLCDYDTRENWRHNFAISQISACSQKCLQCSEHKTTREQIHGNERKGTSQYTCMVCKETWLVEFDRSRRGVAQGGYPPPPGSSIP